MKKSEFIKKKKVYECHLTIQNSSLKYFTIKTYLTWDTLITPFNLLLRSRLEVAEKTENSVTVKCGANKAVLVGAPFRLDMYSGDQLTVSANARGLMRFEHHRAKPQP